MAENFVSAETASPERFATKPSSELISHSVTSSNHNPPWGNICWVNKHKSGSIFTHPVFKSGKFNSLWPVAFFVKMHRLQPWLKIEVSEQSVSSVQVSLVLEDGAQSLDQPVPKEENYLINGTASVSN